MGVLRAKVAGSWEEVGGAVDTDTVGIPAGGATNEILTKTSGSNYDVAWVDRFGLVADPREIDGDTGQFSNITIVDDNTDTGTWPERFRWNFRRFSDGRTRRVFFLNEYGEARCVPAKDSTVPLRIFAQEFASDGTRDTSVPLFEIMDNRDDRVDCVTINNQGSAWFAGNLAVDGELFFDAAALAAALETIVLEAAAPAPGVGVWLRKS